MYKDLAVFEPVIRAKTDGDEKGERPCYRQMDNVHEVDSGSGQVGP